MSRCKWCNLKNPLYIKYHDEEWCKPNFNEKYLFEMLILESFQAGLSWECVLNKREAFRSAYDNFDIKKIIMYDDKKIEELVKKQYDTIIVSNDVASFSENIIKKYSKNEEINIIISARKE